MAVSVRWKIAKAGVATHPTQKMFSMDREYYLEILKTPIVRHNLSRENWSADNSVLLAQTLPQLHQELTKRGFTMVGFAVLPPYLQKQTSYEDYKYGFVYIDDALQEEFWFHIGELHIFSFLHSAFGYDLAEEVMQNY